MANTAQKTDTEAMLRERIQLAIDELSLEDLYAIDRYATYLRSMARNPVLKALLNAPFDDEPESEEERAALEEALEDVRGGRLTSHDDVRRRLLGRS